MKAGLLEVAHVFVVNKADRPGANSMLGDLREALSLRTRRSDWREPLLATEATTGRGIPELVDALDRHRKHLESAGLLAEHRRQAARDRIRGLVDDEMRASFWRDDGREGELERLTARVVEGRMSPRGAARELLTK
jgi:LAO/AO transport system kinase